MRIVYVTGFGPFGPHETNPSGWLAEQLEHPFRVLDVRFTAIDALYNDASWQDADVLLHLGLHGGAKRMHLEQFAFNEIGDHPDNDGLSRTGSIQAGAPRVLGTTLLPQRAPDKRYRVTFDAGRYLCNAIYYQSLLKFPDKRVGFVHVPPEAAMTLPDQLTALQDLLARILEA